MEDEGKTNTLETGLLGPRPPVPSGLSVSELIAMALSALWLLGVTVFFFVMGTRSTGASDDSVRGLTVIFAIFMPIALIWVATMAASSARLVRQETRRLETALETMRHAYVTQGQTKGTALSPSIERKLDQLAAAQKTTDAALATFSSTRQEDAPAPTPRDAPSPEEVEPVADTELPLMPQAPVPTQNGSQGQQSLALEESVAESEPITIEDFITAMNFPKTADDKAGFQSLRRAMKDRRAAGVLQASQDLLTLLSQEGIYMDDLRPDPARPELWRRFAQGERGRAIAALGGIRDRSGISLTSARMRKDPIFRDTAHHFLRRFDKVFAEFEGFASDAEIIALSETRTARAFMLLGRVAGTFD